MKMGQSKSVWKDLSGNGNDGQLVNFGYTEDSGWSGGGLKFDGVDDYVNISPDFDFGTDSFTIEIMSKHYDYEYPLTNFAIMNNNLAYREGEKGFQIGHGYHSSGVNVIVNDGTNLIVRRIGKPPELNEKVHAIFVFDRKNGNILYFYDGELVGKFDISEITGDIKHSNLICIGHVAGWRVNMSLYSFKIYNRALTDEEILQNYQATHFLLEPKTFTSTSYYNFYDLNRVEINTLATKDLAEVLRGDINLEDIVFDRDMKSIPFADVLNRVEGNINILGNKLYKPKGWTQPKLDWRYNQPFSYEDANRLEKNLLLLYNYAKGNIDKIPYCGMYTCGEEVI